MTTITKRTYILKRVNYGGGTVNNITNQITEEVDDSTIEIDDDQITHVGDTRDGDLLSDIIDDLLYVALTVSSFLINGAAQLVRERGNTLDTIDFSWDYNHAVTSQSITGVSLTSGERAKELTAQGITTDTSWTLTGNDGTTEVTKVVSALFRDSVRWIAMTQQTITSVLLQTWDSELRADANTVFEVDAASDQYIYFAAPQSFGTLTFVINGFDEIFIQTAFTFVNEFGVSVDYYIYRSENVGLGLTDVTVQQP